MNLLNKLCETMGPTGFESSVCMLLQQELAACGYDSSCDDMGNLTVHVPGEGARVMLAAHMDEPGVLSTFIEKNGQVRFAKLGRLCLPEAVSQYVRFANGATGVIKCDGNNHSDAASYYIDFGCSSQQEAEELIAIGESGAFDVCCREHHNRIFAKNLSSRISCACLVETIKQLENPKNDLYFVFAVQKELGMRGIKTAVANVKPQYAVIVDGIAAVHEKKSENTVVLGNGLGVKFMDSAYIIHPYMKERILDVCSRNHISYQIEVTDKTCSDAGNISLFGTGVPTATIGIPCGYAGAPIETADINDIQTIQAFLTELLREGV